MGKENESGLFCSNCGIPIDIPKTDKEDIKLTLKPKFILSYQLLNISVSYFLLIVLIVFVLTKRNFSINWVDLFVPIFLFVCSFFLVIIKAIMKYLQYKKLQYDFYNDRLEFIDSFVNFTEKEVKYNSIREVVMTQSILERLFNIGTIRIYTSANSGYVSCGFLNLGGNGIMIRSLDDVKTKYSIIKKIINK